MVLSRLDLVKDFIVHLTNEFNKEIYKILRDNNTPLEISRCWEWCERNSFKTIESSYDYILDDCFIDEIIDEWESNTYIQEYYEVRHGAEQVVICFNDEVYKVSSNNVCDMVNSLIDNLDDNFKPMILPCFYEGFYKGCYIYRQDKVKLVEDIHYYKDKAKSLKVDIYTPNSGYIRSDNCCAAIALKYGVDYLEQFCEQLVETGWSLDIHNENFGIDENGDVKIFDPIYEEVYY